MSDKMRRLLALAVSAPTLLYGFAFGQQQGWLFGAAYAAGLILLVLFLFYVVFPRVEHWIDHGFDYE